MHVEAYKSRGVGSVYSLSLSLGGLLFTAFFIATDPVTSPDTRAGRILFGATIGVLTELIREFGLYADGFCFAVLAANLLVPQIDRLVLRIQRPWYTRTPCTETLRSESPASPRRAYSAVGANNHC